MDRCAFPGKRFFVPHSVRFGHWTDPEGKQLQVVPGHGGPGLRLNAPFPVERRSSGDGKRSQESTDAVRVSNGARGEDDEANRSKNVED